MDAHTRTRWVGSCCVRNDVIPTNPKILESVNLGVGVSYRRLWIIANSSSPSDMQG